MAWIHLSQNCQVVGLDGDTLTLGFANAGARDSFVSSGCSDIVREAALDVVGATWKIDTIVDPGAQPPAQAEAPVVVKERHRGAGSRRPGARARTGRRPHRRRSPPDPRSAPRPATRSRGPVQGADAPRENPLAAADADADPDDLTVDEESLGSEDLLARELGATMIEEIPTPMTQNPFDALGGAGGFDMNALLQQAQQMQEQLASAQERLAEATADGTVAGGAVTVTVNGVGEVVKVAIKAGQFDGGDADDLSDLGDMIVAAYRDAKAQADAMASEALGPLAGGMGGLGGGAPDEPPGQLGF